MVSNMDSIRYETPYGKFWITTDDQDVLSISYNGDTFHYEIKYTDETDGNSSGKKLVSIPEIRVYEAILSGK